MKDCISKILNLQGYIIYKVMVKAKEILVWVGRPKKESKCPYCHSIKRISYGFRNVEVYVKKNYFPFLPPFLLYYLHTF